MVLSKDQLRSLQRNRLGQHNWADDDKIPMENKILRWTYDTLLKQRHILYDDLAEELGISRSAVGQAFDRILTTQNLTVQSIERLDRAISSISSKRHIALGHTWCRGENDTLCIGISTSIPDQKVAEAKYRGEYERLYKQPVPQAGFGFKPSRPLQRPPKLSTS